MTTYENQKSIAGSLDLAASRVDGFGATGKQCWYLAKLLMDIDKDGSWIGCGWTSSNARLTKSQASAYISDLLAA